MTLFRLTKKIPAQEKIAELERRIQDLEKKVENQKRLLYTIMYGGNPIKMECIYSHWQRGWTLFDAGWREFDRAFKDFFKGG